MKTRSSFAALAAPALVAILASGCGSTGVNLWPFGGEQNLERSRVPANSITYQCAGGKRFYLRYLDNGAAAWVILPEREFRLERAGGDGTQYGNGKADLRVGADETSLTDGPTVSYTGCKIPSAEPPPPAKK